MRLIFGTDGGARHEKHVTSGRGTGWCEVMVENDPTAPPRLMDGGQVVGGPDQWLDAITLVPKTGSQPAALAAHRATEFVTENFTLINARAKIDPLEIVGMMKMLARTTGRPHYTQEPSQRNLVSHDDLKRIGWWPGGAGHADQAQAIRHVLSRLLREGHLGTATMLKPPGSYVESLAVEVEPSESSNPW